MITLITNFPENQCHLPSLVEGEENSWEESEKPFLEKLSTGLVTMLIQIVMKTVMKKAKMRMKRK